MANGPDFFGEEELLTRMRKYLVTNGWSLAGAEALEKKLQVADYNPQTLLPTLTKDWSLADWTEEAAVPETVVISEEHAAALPAFLPVPDVELKGAFGKAIEADWPHLTRCTATSCQSSVEAGRIMWAAAGLSLE